MSHEMDPREAYARYAAGMGEQREDFAEWEWELSDEKEEQDEIAKLESWLEK